MAFLSTIMNNRGGIATTIKGGLWKNSSPAKVFKLSGISLWPKNVIWGTGKTQHRSNKIPEVVNDAPKETLEGNSIRSSILSGSKNTSSVGFFRVLMGSWTIAGFLLKVREISGDTTERIVKFFDKVKDTLKGIAAFMKLFRNWKDASISDFLASGGKILLVLFAVYVVWKTYIKRRYVVSPPSLVDALGTNANPRIVHQKCRY